jgi:hypothetical protein
MPNTENLPAVAMAENVAGATPTATVITLSPAFKVILLCVMALTILFLGSNFYLAVAFAHPTPEDIRNLGEKCATAWQMGFGAIVGLIGGKAV